MFKRWVLALLLAVLSVGALAAPHKATPPTIIATQNFLNVTAPLATTVLTPTVTGMYRISVYVECANIDCAVSANLAYTDVGGFQNPGLTGPRSGDFVLRLLAGTPVQLLANSFPTEGVAYNVFIVVEQLF